MAEDTLTPAGIGNHGAARLPSVDIDSYNIELKDEDGDGLEEPPLSNRFH